MAHNINTDVADMGVSLLMMTSLRHGVVAVVAVDPNHHGRDFHSQVLLVAWVTAVDWSVFCDYDCRFTLLLQLLLSVCVPVVVLGGRTC